MERIIKEAVDAFQMLCIYENDETLLHKNTGLVTRHPLNWETVEWNQFRRKLER
jgi:hypothetical protein